MAFTGRWRGLGLFVLATWLSVASGQAVEVTDETAVKSEGTERPVGQDAARKYFRVRNQKSDEKPKGLPVVGDRYMSLHLGTFLSEDVYKWGHGPFKDVGQLTAGVGYKIGEWTGSMDLIFKADVTTYSLQEGRAVKLSLMPAVVFPDADSGFPVYFGAGAGVGIFFKQIEDESSLSFDYTVFAGARLFEVLGSVGLTVEAGMKNHILLLSDGQYNGVFISFGTVHRF